MMEALALMVGFFMAVAVGYIAGHYDALQDQKRADGASETAEDSGLTADSGRAGR